MNEELELKNLTERVIAAGGRAGRKDGNFTLGFDESDGYKRGDEHREIEGLLYWGRNKSQSSSSWCDIAIFSVKIDHQIIRHKIHYDNNKDLVKNRQKKWREENREKEAERHRSYYLLNKDKKRERDRAYSITKKDKITAKHSRRRASIKDAVDPNSNSSVIESRYAASHYLRDVTGIDWHVDHTEPISRGGKHHEDNLQVVPSSWNSGKCNTHSNRWFEDSDLYRYATAVEKRFEREAIEAQGD